MANRWYLIAAVAACAIAASGTAWSCPTFTPVTGEPTVACGSDYFETQPGTSFNGIPFMGDPIGPGMTDTIVQRTADIPIVGTPETDSALLSDLTGPSPSPNLMITALSLESMAPVNLSLFGGPDVTEPIYAVLDSNPTGIEDMGEMSIAGTTAGGTFDSVLNVYFDICLVPSGDGVGCPEGDLLAAMDVTLENSGASWSPDPAAGTELVAGPYCEENACSPTQLDAEQAADLHTFAIAVTDAAPLPEGVVDFFPLSVAGAPAADECTLSPAPPGCHTVDPAPVPEPASLALFGTGLLALVARRRRRAEGRG